MLWLLASFVSKKKIPQLADHQQVFETIHKQENIAYPVLVPNMQGLKTAQGAGVKEIAVFTAASETFAQRNIDCSIGESLHRYSTLIHTAKKAQMRVRGYISCSFGCPYEGKIDSQQVSHLASKLQAYGCDEICISDTIGVATANEVHSLITVLKEKIPQAQLAMHFHDTYGQALTNIYVSLCQGITTFDCSVSGLGGCPYARGATGNIASEDVVYMLQGLGIATHIDLKKLIAAGQYIDNFLQRQTGSKVAKALT